MQYLFVFFSQVVQKQTMNEVVN